MKNTFLLATLALSLFSCASNAVSVGGAHSRYDSGIAAAASSTQTGLEVNYLTGNDTVMLDVGFRTDSGTQDQVVTDVRSKQLTTHIGARLYAPSKWNLRAYVGAGVMHQYNSFVTKDYDYGDNLNGTYGRVGVEAKITDGLGVEVAYETNNLGSAKIGGRTGLDLNDDTILLGFVFRF